MSSTLEIACFSPLGAMIAAHSSCDRLELCSSYAEGGLTPSHAYLEHVRRQTDKELFVMIRTVSGFTSWSNADEEVMRDDVRFCKMSGMNGIVTGLLRDDKTIDQEFIKRFVEYAFPLPVTFHRAFDHTPDLFDSMEILIRCGVKRILTSGGTKNAEDGIETIRKLNEKAKGRIIILPGGGVSILNAGKILKETGCTEIHSSGKGNIVYSEITPDENIITELKKQIARI